MKTTSQPTRTLTAERVQRAHSLYTAAAFLLERASLYRIGGDYARARRADRAHSRLSSRAYVTLLDSLPSTELTRLCTLQRTATAVAA